ncbi:hypothetical protein BGZ54_008862, partial [Gamsiella multidivaricata]
VDSQGMVYKATINFPASYLIVTVPSGCTFLSSGTVSCQSSGQNQFAVSFPNITAMPDGITLLSKGAKVQEREEKSAEDDNSGHIAVLAATVLAGIPPSADSVVVNGETCVVDTTCPTLSRSNGTSTSSRVNTTTTPSSVSESGQQGGDVKSSLSSSSSSSNKGMIIGISCGVVAVLLIAVCVVLRRNMTSASSTGVKRQSSQYSLSRENNSGAYGGPDGYALYREKTMRRQRSIREFHEAAAAKAAEEAVHRGLERMKSEERMRATIERTGAGGADGAGVGADGAGVGAEKAGAIELARHPSSREAKSNTAARSNTAAKSNTAGKSNIGGKSPARMLDTSVIKIPSASLFEDGKDFNAYFPSETGVGQSGSRGTTRPSEDMNRIQHPPVRKSKSSRFPWPEPESSATPPSTSTQGQNALHRTVSAGTIKSTASRPQYHTDNTIRHQQQQQQYSSRPNGFDNGARSTQPRPSVDQQQRHHGLRSEPILLPPQSLPAAQTRSQHIMRTDDKAGSHGLYGYM